MSYPFMFRLLDCVIILLLEVVVFRQLRVYHLVNALSTDFCQPLFYGFCFLGGDGLNDTKNAFKVSGVGFASFLPSKSCMAK